MNRILVVNAIVVSASRAACRLLILLYGQASKNLCTQRRSLPAPALRERRISTREYEGRVTIKLKLDRHAGKQVEAGTPCDPHSRGRQLRALRGGQGAL